MVKTLLEIGHSTSFPSRTWTLRLLLINHSGFVEDAELDISLGKLACDLRSVKGICRVISATSESSIWEFRFSSGYPDGIQGTYIYLLLLSAFPYYHQSVHNVGVTDEVNAAFWTVALKDFPSSPLLDQSLNHPPLPHDLHSASCWISFDFILSD